MLALAPVALTHTGLRRRHNEDTVFATARLAAVADGVGGAVAAEVASRAASRFVVADVVAGATGWRPAA